MITFIIHSRKDTEERVKNMEIIIPYYQSILPDCKFVVVEDDKTQNFDFVLKYPNVEYCHYYNEDQHRKCVGYNIGLKKVSTELVCFLDMDCLISKENLLKAIEESKRNDSIYIGYNGICVYFTYVIKNTLNQMDKDLYDYLSSYVDMTNLTTGYNTGNYYIANTKAVGGVLIGKTRVFKSVGGFNPNFKGWGYEDNEFPIRCKILQVPVYYINTSKALLFHLPHIDDNKKNTEPNHKSYLQNQQEYLKILNFNKNQLIEYINTWKI
jgi:predicted glycosyltransferase involved in capsule biosynthesis